MNDIITLEKSEHCADNSNIVVNTISKRRSEKAPENEFKEPLLKCRYVIAFIGFLIFLLLSIHRTVMSVTILAMVNHTAISHLSKEKSDSCLSLKTNGTEDDNFHSMKKEGEFIWSPKIQGYVLGSYFFGYLITQIPTGILTEKYGCKWFLFTSSLVTGVLTLLIPPMSWLSASAVIAIQTVRGLFQGLIQPSIAVLLSNWFPKNERGFMYAFTSSATCLGTAFGSIFTGYVCDSPGGWPYSFYSLGIAGLVLSISILIFVAENPKVHPRISKTELNFILSNQENTLDQKRPKRPWGKILTSIPVYALAIGFFGHIWAISQFWTVQSTFLGTILHYPITENGIFTAVPFFLQFVTQQIASWITLYMQQNSITSVNFLRKFWTFISGSGFSCCLMGMYFAECNRTLSIIFGIMSVGFIGLGAPGIGVVVMDMSPTFAGTLHGFSYTIAFTATFALPVIVGFLTDKMQTIEQWNKVFFISAGIVMITKMIFVFFGSAEIQSWNFVEEYMQDKAGAGTEICRKKNAKNKNEEMTRF